MTGPIDVDALLAWCVMHIACDACSVMEGATYLHDEDRFLCPSDVKMLHLLFRTRSDDPEPDV